METKIKIYGPPIGKAIDALLKLAKILPTISNGSLGSGIVPSGETIMGDFDFVFHWTKKPSEEQLMELIAKIDDVLSDINCRYSTTTVETSDSPYRL